MPVFKSDARTLEASYLVNNGIEGDRVVQWHHESWLMGAVERLVVDVHPGLNGVHGEAGGTGVDM